MRVPQKVWSGAVLALAAGGLSVLPAQSSQQAATQAAEDVPAPEEVLGFEPCADYKLATYEKISEYFQELDDASDRVQLVDTGETTLGRTQWMAIISSEENLADLDRYQEISQRLARAEDLAPEEAQELADEGKAVAWVDFGIHSTEVATHQTAPWFAYQLAADDSDEMQQIRDNVITLVVPNTNPDGGTQVADWYMEHVGTKYQDAPLPELYHPYAGHDNNRDWYMFNLQETRNLGRQLFHEWIPQVMHNQHQTGPFPSRIFVPPFEEPMNPQINPRVIRGVNLVGTAMTERLDREGKVGAVSGLQYDMWWNGGMRSAPYYHNMIGILTETSHATATPIDYDPADFPETFANGESTTQPSIFYPSPWQGGRWHLRQSCAYMNTTSLAMLDLASEKRDELLYGIYEMGREAIEAGADQTYVVPADQVDFPTAVKMITPLRHGGIEVERATAPFSAGGRTYPEGSFVIRGAQAFRPLLEDLMNPQEYPDRRVYPGGPPDVPYDITGWTLPLQMGVEVDKLATDVEAQTEPVDFPEPPAGVVSDDADVAYALDPRVNDSVTTVNRVLAAGGQVSRATTAVRTDQGRYPAGAFLIEPDSEIRGVLEAAAEELGVDVAALNRWPDATATVKAPRVGLYYGYDVSDDQGWNRQLLEQFEFDFDLVNHDVVRAGDLRGKYDVLILPDDDLETMRDGMDADEVPAQYAGGMTRKGLQNVRQFVRQGGTLVALDSANELPMQVLGIPVTDASAGLPEDEFFIPGTLLRLRVDPTHPVAYGMPRQSTAFFAESPAFEVADPGAVESVASYPGSNLRQSGWTLGEELLYGRDAVLDAPYGQGQVVMLGFRAQHRNQAHGTYKLYLNSLYLTTTRP
jgi:Zinc carboxypeptidase